MNILSYLQNIAGAIESLPKSLLNLFSGELQKLSTGMSASERAIHDHLDRVEAAMRDLIGVAKEQPEAAKPEAEAAKPEAEAPVPPQTAGAV